MVEFIQKALCAALNSNSLNLPPNAPLAGVPHDMPYVFAADEAFPLTQRIMKPYPQRNLSREQRKYNTRFSRGRHVVENAFGILASRFRVFLTTINLHPEKVEKVILAATVLHNLVAVRKRGRYLPPGAATSMSSLCYRHLCNKFYDLYIWSLNYFLLLLQLNGKTSIQS